MDEEKLAKLVAGAVELAVSKRFNDLEESLGRQFGAVHEDIADARTDFEKQQRLTRSELKFGLEAVNSKLSGVHRRIDEEMLKRQDLERRVRSAVPNLPSPPERV